MSRYPTVRLNPHAKRRARGGAPWIFSNEIVMNPATKALARGTVVNVAASDGSAVGAGYFNPGSLISVRLLSECLDTPFDAEFFAGRIARALKLRERLGCGPYYRLINAEGDDLPGLTVDRFADTLVVQIATAGMETLQTPVLVALEAVVKPKNILLRGDVPARALEGLESYVRPAKGEAGRITVEENGVSYRAELSAGQKTGWYYDLREARAFVATLCTGGSLLDAYCYSGGFSLAAARAGARETLGVDSSAPAIALAAETAAAENLPSRFEEADAEAKLETLAAAGRKFDVVAADPPPFVKARKDLEAGARAYRKLAKLAAVVVAPEGFLFLACCSHNMPADRFAVECAAGIAKTGRRARLVRYGGAGCDHPTHPQLPESAYLKWLAYALD